MGRLFHGFPAGRAGFGLLLLRSALGTLLVIQGGRELTGNTDSANGMWIAGLLAVAAGASLLAGFLTPIAAVVVALGSAGAWLSGMPWNPFPSALLVGFVVAVDASILLLGPGAFSIDARLFGLREVIIPRAHTPN